MKIVLGVDRRMKIEIRFNEENFPEFFCDVKLEGNSDIVSQIWEVLIDSKELRKYILS